MRQKGKALWDNLPRRGVIDRPSSSSWMKIWRFEEIRRLIEYTKADLIGVHKNSWARFRRAVHDFSNATRIIVI